MGKDKWIDEYRLIPKDTEFWSISNQETMSCGTDQIVQVKHTCAGNDVVFVKPMQLMGNMPGHVPGLMSKGTDEWELNYSKTEPYRLPKPEYYYKHARRMI